MKKKYTMEEFENMFTDAMATAMAKLERDMDRAEKEHGKPKNSMMRMIFFMQNMTAMAALQSELFKKEKGEVDE